MMKVEITGDAVQKLEELQRNLEKLDGDHEIGFDELFPPAFMTEFTQFPTIGDMLAKSGFAVTTSEDFAAIPDDEWDAYVARTTTFSTWQATQESAVQRWTQRQLGL